MIEGGRIDHAGHANDAGWLLHEILKFDEDIGSVFNWVKDRDDTLVIITADHETGSFGFSYSAYNIPKPSLLTGESFKNRKFGPQFNFGSYEVLDKIYNQKKTLTMISRLFDKLPSNKRTAEQLEQLVNKNLEFKITLEQAKEILEEEVNQYYVEGHPYLGFKMTPPIHDFKAFYGYINNNRQALIARKIAKQQQIVWGTGAHTTTPVVVVAFGPKPFQNKFDGLLHSTEIGKKCIESMGY
jgi:alkaline phosphatase